MSDRTETTDATSEVLGNRWTTRLWAYRIPIGLVAIVLGLKPLVAHPWVLGFGSVASSILLWMVFVASFNLLLGYTGILSFGHAIFLGFGTYAVAIGISRFDLPFVVAVAGGVLVAAVVGYAIASLIAEKGEIYLAMLTLAFGQATWFVFNQNPFGLTGGDNGISQNVLPPWIDSFRGQKRVVVGALAVDWYWVVGAVFLVTMVVLWQVIRSPFGRTLVAVRDNEPLARAMGVDTVRYKIWSFTFAGAIAAVAGAFLSINNQGATTQVLDVVTSGDAILMAVLGGTNYFFGPLAGTFLWRAAEEYLTSFETLALPLSELPLVTIQLTGVFEHWRFFLGLLFVIVVLVAPDEGVWGFVVDRTERLWARVQEVRR
jgi:branched-chain amino acid transport system permease protein